MNRSARQINALTTLRFFAALLVVVFHHGQSAFASAPSWCQSVIKGGYVGVPFFFVLSGFILAYNYLPEARAGTLDNRRFWVARFARIYPVYAVALLLCAPLVFATLRQTLPSGDAAARFGLQSVLCFGLIQAWTPHWAFTWNGPAWSLSVEAFFYLAFPFLTKQLDTKGRWALLAGFVCGVGALVSLGWLCGWNVIASAQQVLGWTNPVLWLALFVLGVCAGDLHLRRCAAEDGTNQRPFRTAVITIGLMALILLVVSSSLQRRSQLLLCYAVTVPCALLICLLAKDGNPVSRWLDWRGLVLLGEASYSLYILHRPVHDWFGWMSNRWGLISPSTTGGFVFYLATCLALSVLALKWIEYPCRDWIKRRLGTRSVRSANVSRVSDTCTATVMQ
jgi:peptidoglycan/LPS O-acetylase OafA/YrhL